MNRSWVVRPKNEKIMEVSTREWLSNTKEKDIPTPDSKYYEQFWDFHLDLARNGTTVDGVFFPGVLYWHLNMWTTDIDVIDEFGNPISKQGLCELRDNEWIIFNAIHEAERMDRDGGRKGLAIGGSRRIAKSTFIASYLSHGITTDFNSQNVFAGLNGDDIDVTLGKIRQGLNHIPEALKYTALNKSGWTDHTEVNFGYRKPNNDTEVFSKLVIRNLEGGNKEETIAGTKPKRLVIEEAAKGNFLKGLIAAKPGFTTRFGSFCSPIAIFTGGDAEKFENAKSLFFSPEAYDFLTFEEEFGGSDRKHGLFLGEKYRQEAKEESTLGEYLEITKKTSPLFKIPIQVSNEHKAKQVTEREIDALNKEGKHEEAIKTRMYYPRKVDDIFQSARKTKYSHYSKQINTQITKLLTTNNHGMQVELEEENGKVTWKYSDKQPILDLNNTNDLDAPVTIFEHPVEDPPKFLYVAGVDTYRQSGGTEGSYGAIYIYKRGHQILGENYKEMIVAKYVARPIDRHDWDATAELLIRYYNAYSLVENDELGFIDHMRHRDLAEKYLSPQPELQKRVNPNTALNRPYGLSRRPDKIRNHLDSQYGRYINEVIYSGYGEEQKEEDRLEIRGVETIPCVLLLRQTQIYDGVINTDTVIAFQLALAMARELDIQVGTTSEFENTARKAISKPMTKKRGTFGSGRKSFRDRRGLFKR